MPAKEIKLEELGAELNKVIHNIVREIQLAVVESGTESTTYMQEFIKEKTNRQRRPGKGSIRKYIKSYYPALNHGGFIFGIGSISLLNSKAKYWKRLENGFLPPAYPGYWRSRYGRKKYMSWETTAPNFGKQIFYPSWGFPKMIPKKAYPGMKYMYYTYRHLITILSVQLHRRISKLKN